MNDWFHSIHSNDALRRILAEYSAQVNGKPVVLPRKAGRCTLVRELEKLDAIKQPA